MQEIGKSLFLYYFMQSLAAAGQTVVLQRICRSTVVYTKEGAFVGRQDGTLSNFGYYLDDTECW